ncbi:MAG TPA: helix-turn-helix domain-containing protein [Xanthobacteraceae bacterium]|nr:helix-turn-helix domain-containing protein [Xanthobacteraceae bacterium]
MAEQSILTEYESEEALAANLGVCIKTLQRWRIDKKGPPVTRLGRRILYRRVSVKTWLEAREAKARNAA